LDAIQAPLAAYPAAAEVADTKNGCIPLHLACDKALLSDVIQALLAAFTAADEVADIINGCLSLPLACDKALPSDVIQELLAAFPAAAEVANKDSYLPLHPSSTTGCVSDGC
jgi:hypothetical protein